MAAAAMDIKAVYIDKDSNIRQIRNEVYYKFH